MIFDFRLKVFRTVAEKLSFTKAAGELFISQPAVTKHINELEKQIGQPLFNRHGNSISLTREGKLLLSYAKKIQALYHELDEELDQLQQHISGRLRIGASTSIAQYILPPIMAEFRSIHPDVELILINGNSQQINNLVKDNSVDLGLIEGNTLLPELHYASFINDEIVLVTHINNKGFSQNRVNLEVLKEIPLVIRESGSGTLAIVEQALEKEGIKRKDLNIEIQLGSTESIKKYLMHSQAFAFLSVHTIHDELESNKLKIVETGDFQINRTFRFITLHGKHSRLIRLFKHYSLKRYN